MMPLDPRTFVDNSGDRWTISLTFGLCNKLREQVDFEPLKVLETDLRTLAEVVADYERLVPALYVVLEQQLSARNFTPEAFAERLGGSALESAGQAFARAVIDFFPEPRRGLGHAALDKAGQIVPQMLAAAVAEIAALPDDLAAITSKASAAAAAESSESTQTTTASAT